VLLSGVDLLCNTFQVCVLGLRAILLIVKYCSDARVRQFHHRAIVVQRRASAKIGDCTNTSSIEALFPATLPAARCQTYLRGRC